MKKFICLGLVFVMAFPLFAGGGGEKKAAGGKVIIYTSMYQDVIDAVKGELNKQFPKYDIEFVYGGTGGIQAKIASEQASGRLGCDILMVAEPAYSLELKEKGLLYAHKSKEASSLAFDYDPDGYWYPVRISNMVLAYNPDKYAKTAVPNSFESFANDSSVRNAVSMRNPLTSGTAMAAVSALRDKYGYVYFNELGRQNIQIDYNTDIMLKKLETGENKVVMVLEESILKVREEGSRLEVIYPTDGTVVIPSTIMIINSKWSASRNTQAAEAITDWFLSEAGQNAIVSGWMHSVRTNFPRIPYDSRPTADIWADRIPINWETNFRQRQEIQDRFQEYMASRN